MVKKFFQKLVLLLIISSLILTFSPLKIDTVQAGSYTVDLVASFDTWIQSNTWHNDSVTLQSQDISGDNQHMVIEWDLSSIPECATIDTVWLQHFTSFNDKSGNDCIKYYNCTVQPSETSQANDITWLNPLKSSYYFWSGHCYNENATSWSKSIVQNAIDTNRDYFAIAVSAYESSYGQHSEYWRSTENVLGCVPTLTITYSVDDIPILTNPFPSDGAVDISIPVTTSIDYSHSAGLATTLKWYVWDGSDWYNYATNNVNTNGTKSNILLNVSSPVTTYQWKITAEDSAGKWTNTSTFSFTTAGVSPPSNVHCSRNGTTGINVTFTKYNSSLLASKQKTLNIQNSNNSYPMFINVSYTNAPVNCSGHCNINFSDVRFWNFDNTIELSYWIEKKVNGEYAWFWVKTPSDLTVDAKFLMKYDGNSKNTTSNGDATFIYFENWNVDNTSQWIENTNGNDYYYSENTENNTYGRNIRLRWLMNVTVWNTVPIGNDPISIFPNLRSSRTLTGNYSGLNISNTRTANDSDGDSCPTPDNNYYAYRSSNYGPSKDNWTFNDSGSTGATQSFLDKFYEYEMLFGCSFINSTMSYNNSLILYSVEDENYPTSADLEFLAWTMNDRGISHTFTHANSEYLKCQVFGGAIPISLIETYTDWMFAGKYTNPEPSVSSTSAETSTSESYTVVYYSPGYTPPVWGSGTFAANTTGELVEVTGLSEGACYSFSLWTNYYDGTIWTLSSRTTISPCCTKGGNYTISFRYENTSFQDDNGIIEPTDYFNNYINLSHYNCSTHRVEVHYEDYTTEFYYVNASWYENNGYDSLHINTTKEPLYITVWWNWSIIGTNHEGYNCPCTYTNSYKRTLIPRSGEIDNDTLDFYFITDRHIYNDYYIDNPTDCTLNLSYIIDNNLAHYYFKFDDRTSLFDSKTGIDTYSTIYYPNATKNLIIHQEYWDTWQRIYPTLLYNKQYLVGCNCSALEAYRYSCVGITPNKLDVAPAEATIIINPHSEDSDEFASKYQIDFGWQSSPTGLYVSFFDSGYNTTKINCSIICYETGITVYEHEVNENEWNFTFNGANKTLSYIITLNITHNEFGELQPITFVLSTNTFIASSSYIVAQFQDIFGNLPSNLLTGETIRWIMLPIFIIGLIPLSIFGKFSPGIASLGVGFWMFGGNFMLNIDTLLIPGFFLIFVGVLMFIAGRSRT